MKPKTLKLLLILHIMVVMIFGISVLIEKGLRGLGILMAIAIIGEIVTIIAVVTAK